MLRSLKLSSSITGWVGRYQGAIYAALAGLLITIYLFLYFFYNTEHTNRQALVNRTAELSKLIAGEVNTVLFSLEDIQSFYKGSHFVERSEFTSFTGPILKRQKHIKALAWIPKMDGRLWSDYENQAKAAFPDFQFTEFMDKKRTPLKRESRNYYPIYYLEPYHGNEPLLGTDLSTNKTHRATLDKARDMGKVILSEKFVLPGHNDHYHYILMVVPIYESNKETGTKKQRQEALDGFIAAMIDIPFLLEHPLGLLEPSGTHYLLLDDSTSPSVTLLYRHISRAYKHGQALPHSTTAPFSEQFYRKAFLTVDRKWSLVGIPITEKGHFEAWLVLAIGLFGTFVLTFYLVKAEDNRLAVLSSYQKYSLILDTAEDGICGLDTKGQITFINASVTRITGFSQIDLLGKSQHDVMHHPQEDGTPFPTHGCPGCVALHRNKKYHINSDFFLKKDGSLFPVEHTTTPFPGTAQQHGFVMVFRDISSQKETEKLSKKYSYHQNIIHSLFQTSFSYITLEKQLAHALDQILEIPCAFGDSKGAVFLFDEEKKELYMVAQRGLHPDHSKTCRRVPLGYCLCGKAAATKKTIFSQQTSQAHEITFNRIESHGYCCIPILTGKKILGVFMVHLGSAYQKVQEEKKTLESIANTLALIITRKSSENELENRVIARTQELQESLEILQKTKQKMIESEKMAALGSLVAGIAHEIKTPIGISFMTSSHLEDETKKIATTFTDNTLEKDKLREYIETAAESSKIILSNLRRAANMIQSFKSIATDQTTQEKRTFNIYTYLQEIFLSLKPKMEQKMHNIEVTCDDALEVSSYPGILAQIVTNLVVNSLIHGFEGKNHGTILINVTEQDRGGILLLYQDNGKGMEASVCQRVFEPFFTTKRGQGGSGLGMHIVYNLVTQRLNGHIQCQNRTDDTGITFKIAIPDVVVEKSL